MTVYNVFGIIAILILSVSKRKLHKKACFRYFPQGRKNGPPSVGNRGISYNFIAIRVKHLHALVNFGLSAGAVHIPL